MKKNQTPAEEKLRQKLRKRQCLWYKFYRQKALFLYREETGVDRFVVVDFYCHVLKLIIEVDGAVHADPDIEQIDKIKELLLQQQGYTILRFSNERVVHDREWVIATIRQVMADISVDI